MKLRKRLAAMTALALTAGTVGVLLPFDVTPAEAAAPAPVILNPNGQNSAFAQWAESQSMPQSGAVSVQTFHATFLVQHAAGRTIPNVRFDANYDGTDNTGGNGTTGNVAPVLSQTFVAANGSGIETSRVSVAFDVGDPGGFSCPTFGSTTRVRDLPIRLKVVDSTNEVSGTVSTTVRFVENDNCSVTTGSNQDYPRLTSTSQNVSDVVTNQNITYSFSCDDVDTDVFSSDDDCATADVRYRRLDDGTTGSLGSVAMGDNNVRNFTTSFANRGYYVVEVQLRNESGGLPQAHAPTNGWWRIGNAVVNEPTSSLSGDISVSGAGVNTLSTPPSVNPSTAFSASATAIDAGGDVQGIEWDLNLDGLINAADGTASFGYVLPTGGAGADVAHGTLASSALTKTYAASTTATSGLKTITARVTDSGALDMADSQRRQANITGQLRVNALPTASSFTVGATEDQDQNITLSGTNSDNFPNALTFTQLTNVPAAAGSVSCTGSSCVYDPAPNFNGATSFTYRTTDCGANPGACANSAAATVTINVAAVNDAPAVDPKSATTPEDTNVDVTMTGSDVEDGTSLTYTVNSQPTNGAATCTPAGVCTYDPDDNFFGTDSYTVKGTDSGGLTATATVTITVTPVNDAPVANAQTVTVSEDAENHVINLTASDVDNTVLTFSAPISGPSQGQVNCLGVACQYTPDADYNGPDSFTFTASDGSLSSTATVTINVVAVNDAPVATDVLDAVTDEDVPVEVPATGTDVENDPLTATAVTDPANGSASVLDSDTVTYQGDLHFHGIDTFDFTIADGNGGEDDGTVVVTVNPVNDAPEVQDQTVVVNEDDPSIVSIAAGDVDGDALIWSIVSGTSSGLLFGSGPDLGYAPNLNFNGVDTFVVQVSDGELTDTATITITVNPVNDQPVAEAASATTPEDEAVDIELTTSDVDGDTLTLNVLTTPANGGVSCAVFPTCTYTPNGDFHGTDQFLYSADDGAGGTDTASVTITVTPVNDAPTAVAASATTMEDNPVGLSLSATDIEGDSLTYSYGPAGFGTVAGDGPSVVYTPNPNASGTDEFTFTVDDGNGGTDSETVTVEVTAVNDAPVATGGTFTTPEDTNLSFLLGATDVEGDALLFGITSPPESGSLTCDTAGACTYDPEEDFSGSVTAEYSVYDGAATGSGVVTIIVDPVNDLPEPTGPDSVTTAEDTPIGFSLSAADSEDDALTFAVVSGPTDGALACSEDGSCTYTPSTNFNGTDAFTWSVSDGGPAVNGDTSITVLPVNDAPQALDVSAETNEDTAVEVTLLASDAEGDPITYSVDSPPGAGTVSIVGNVATYTPSTDFTGTDTFIYRATDPSGAFTTARVSLVVNEVALIGTSLVGDAAVAQVQVRLALSNTVDIVVFPNMRATLRTSSGAPLAGRTIAFSVGGAAVCSAVTDAQGAGTCSAKLPLVQGLLNLGYQVSFAGDLDHAASTAKGPLVQVLTLRI